MLIPHSTDIIPDTCDEWKSNTCYACTNSISRRICTRFLEPDFNLICYCWGHTVDAVSHARCTTNGMCAKNSIYIRGGHGSGVPESTPVGFCAFFGPETGVKNWWKTGPGITFFVSSAARVCVVFINVIAELLALLNFGSTDSLRSLNRGRILKFEKVSEPYPDRPGFKNFGTGPAHLEKMMMRQMLTRIDFENKNMINAGASPAPSVEAHKADEQEHYERRSVQPEKQQIAAEVWLDAR